MCLKLLWTSPAMLLLLMVVLLSSVTGENISVSSEIHSLINCSTVISPCEWKSDEKWFRCNGVSDLDPRIFQCIPNAATRVNITSSFFGGHIQNNSLQHVTHLDALNISYTDLTQIDSEAFHNLSHLRSLCLFHNNLTNLPDGLFGPLVSLHVLDISYNQITNYSSDVSSSLHGLKRLVFFKARRSNIQNFQFKSLCNSQNLAVVDLEFNSIQIDKRTFLCDGNVTATHVPMSLLLIGNRQLDFVLHDGVFASLSYLKSLALDACDLKLLEPKALQGLVELQYIQISQNFFSDLPEFTDMGRSMVPKLKQINFQNGNLNPSKTELVFEGANNLQYIKLSGNAIKTVSLKGNFSSLVSLSLGKNPVEEIDASTFARMRHLQHLSLAEAGYDIRQKDKDVFSSLITIQSLQLSSNSFKHADVATLNSIFQPLCSLVNLGIQNTQLNYISKNWFHCMENLTYLQLGQNPIVTWDPETFLRTPLKLLEIYNNRITHISKDMLESLPPQIELVAFGNPFECACDLRGFITFIKIQRYHKHWPSGYKCSTPAVYANRLLADYHPGFHECSLFVPLSSGGGALLLLVVGAMLAYRKRWYFRHWWYLLRLRQSRHRALQEACRDYMYEAFVSYSNEDQEWVGSMMTRIESEEESDIRLFVHGRDFRAGRFITENIVEGVEASRKTVVVLSNHYARSEWCKFEMNMAHTKQVEEGKDFLLLILLEPIRQEHMTKTLRYLLSSKTYLEWTEDETGQKTFWKRLRQELERPALAPPRETSADEEETMREGTETDRMESTESCHIDESSHHDDRLIHGISTEYNMACAEEAGMSHPCSGGELKSDSEPHRMGSREPLV